MEFAKQTHTHANMRYFVPSDYFKEYHSWELYNPKKAYLKETFIQNFGKGSHDYCYHSFTIADTNNIAKNAKYVVAEEVLSDKERKNLAPYCQCGFHKRYWFNPLRYLYPPMQAGCLGCDNTFPSQGVIDASKEKKEMRFNSWW